MRRIRAAATAPPMFRSIPCPHCGQRMNAINGAWLKYLREVAGMDQRSFGKLYNASGPYISDIERNRRECPAALLQAYQQLGQSA